MRRGIQSASQYCEREKSSDLPPVRGARNRRGGKSELFGQLYSISIVARGLSSSRDDPLFVSPSTIRGPLATAAFCTNRWYPLLPHAAAGDAVRPRAVFGSPSTRVVTLDDSSSSDRWARRGPPGTVCGDWRGSRGIGKFGSSPCSGRLQPKRGKIRTSRMHLPPQ